MLRLNFHHLFYFYTVAKEGGLRKAASKLHVSQPSISAQIKVLEEQLGEALFRKSGRSNELTETGHIAMRYAQEIFSLGTEMTEAIKRRPGAKQSRFYVGVADSVPKTITNEILKPVVAGGRTHVICREGKVEDLLGLLASHRLDIVLADEPPSTALRIKAFHHPLGESSISFCARPPLAKKLAAGFPGSLHGQAAFLPSENTALRRSLDLWFQTHAITPKIVAEFDDAALMKAMAAETQAFLPVASVVMDEASNRYKLQLIGATDECKERYFAITMERRLTHPETSLITQQARSRLGSP